MVDTRHLGRKIEVVDDLLLKLLECNKCPDSAGLSDLGVRSEDRLRRLARLGTCQNGKDRADAERHLPRSLVLRVLAIRRGGRRVLGKRA